MRLVIAIFCMGALTTGASAQLSITTIGATDAVECYQTANSPFSGDTSACDVAIKDPSLTRRDKMKTYVNRGIIHNHNRDLQLAVDDFNAALEIDDELAEAYLNRGNSFYMSNQLDIALRDYLTALDLDVRKPWAAWYNIGLVYDAQKKSEKAQEAYSKAIALNPEFTLAQDKLRPELE